MTGVPVPHGRADVFVYQGAPPGGQLVAHVQSDDTGQYLVERVKRLLVPLYTVGLFILMVPQAYF